jgi:RNA polymerase sigma-70 factor (ECF subfamily)
LTIDIEHEIAAVFRREYGRAVAVLTRSLRDLTLAEEAVQDAFVAALARWPGEGIPPAPAGWIITTARNRAIDRLRRESTRGERHEAAMQMLDDAEPQEHDVRDSQLRLIFTCCHPALSGEAQLALALRLIGGLTTEEIARAFVSPPATIGQRISRAKAKIRDAGIPFRIPEAPELPERLRGVLAVVYLLFNEGYAATSGAHLQRPELADEAIRLGRLLVELMPGEPEAAGLLALMLLVDSRRATRVDAAGSLVRLPDQDRDRWDRGRIEEGQEWLRDCLRVGRPGPYQLQAAIQAVHGDAPTAAATDWRQILSLYDRLYGLMPTPVVALNRAVAVAQIEGPAAGLACLDAIDLPRHAMYHAVHADLLSRAGRVAEAATAYLAAIDLTDNEREREWLAARHGSLPRN